MRSPLFFNVNAGVIFNPIDYTALDFNKTPVTAPITENPFSTSSVAAPIDNTPAAFFTSSVNNPNTAYPFDNNVSLKPWTPADSANTWAGLGAFGTDGNTSLIFGTDGNIKFNSSEKPLNVYEKTEEQNRKTEEEFRKLKLAEQAANAGGAGIATAVTTIVSLIAKLIPSEGGNA